MKLFDVYPLYQVVPVRAKGNHIFDKDGNSYLDLYGGHAVISIGHSHPHFQKRLKEQIDRLIFYSNSIVNPLQQELGKKLTEMSGCQTYNLFLCNSGAEANENALKIASFQTGKAKVLAFHKSFHGRTSAAVAATDNPKIHAPINKQHAVEFIPLNDKKAFDDALSKGGYCAVILEAIQGVGGLDMVDKAFYQYIAKKCKAAGILLIADEVQSGYGRSGKFFAFQHCEVQPDIITVAKGMGNGFPIGGVLIHSSIEARYGMLGTTFGGNHLACAAGLGVLEVIEAEGLLENAARLETYFRDKALEIPEIKQVKGKGLMLGLEFNFEVGELRKTLIHTHRIFTGGASDKYVLRILPALNIGTPQIDAFFNALKTCLYE